MRINVSLVTVEHKTRCKMCSRKLERETVAIMMPWLNEENVVCVDCGLKMHSDGRDIQNVMALEKTVQERIEWMTQLNKQLREVANGSET